MALTLTLLGALYRICRPALVKLLSWTKPEISHKCVPISYRQMWSSPHASRTRSIRQRNTSPSVAHPAGYVSGNIERDLSLTDAPRLQPFAEKLWVVHTAVKCLVSFEIRALGLQAEFPTAVTWYDSIWWCSEMGKLWIYDKTCVFYFKVVVKYTHLLLKPGSRCAFVFTLPSSSNGGECARVWVADSLHQTLRWFRRVGVACRFCLRCCYPPCTKSIPQFRLI